MLFLPLYTERQVEIAFKISEYHFNGWYVGQVLAEFEFAINPFAETLAKELLKDKKFVKSLRIILRKDIKRLKKEGKKIYE